MELGESKEDYLETIYVLSLKKDKIVRVLDVAVEMNVTKASACLAVKKLTELGYLIRGVDHEIFLTEKGSELGKRIYDRYHFWNSLLTKLGIEGETAKEDACHMEHVLCDESFYIFKAYIDKTFA